VFLVVELAGGFLFGSLALLADAAHMVSDVVALGLAYGAVRLAQRPPTRRHTFGFGRTEVLVAQANALLLFAGAIAVIVEAIRRFGSPHEIDAAGVFVVGIIGLLVNVGSAAVVGRHAHSNMNARGAYWHLLADAFGSLAVIVAAIGTAVFDVDWIDPVASIVISVLVIFAAWRLMRDATSVLLEAVPAGLDVEAVTDALFAEPGVETVHHLHVWTTGSEHAALSAHVVLGETLTLHDAQLRAVELKQMLHDRFGIDHATLEVECHACVDDEVHVQSQSHSHDAH
jgi:cobalt-zinc-cadmium efflux system protein